MSAPAGGGGEGKADGMTILWVIFGLMVIIFIVWYFFKEQLVWAFLKIRLYEFTLVNFFVNQTEVNNGIIWLKSALPEDLLNNTTLFTNISEVIGRYFMYPSVFLIIVMAIFIFKNHKFMRYVRAHNMETLMNQEQKNWPQICPVVNIDLMAMDINKGPWAMTMNPLQFCKAYKLVKVEMVGDMKASWRAEGKVQATVLEEKANRVFSQQLGPLWAGPDKLPPHIKALFAVFVARAEHEPEVARNYLKKLSISAAKGQIDYSETEMILKKYYAKSKPTHIIEQRHAYVSTVMASMLEVARTDGVLASADFLWLKPMDRRMWQMLNNVGRSVAPCEIAGIYAHWLVEKQLLRPISVPMVEQAGKALVFAMSLTIYVPDEDEKIPAIGTQVH
jgi:intracellular multiplication protein IcmP